MPHLPFFKFYPADWLQDTQVLSLEAQGAWMKILCALHVASERGRKKSPTLAWKQFLGYPDGDKALLLIGELAEVAEITCRDEDENSSNLDDSIEITIVSRRMVRDEYERIQELERKRRYEDKNPTRKRQSSDVNPTPILQKSEVRSQKKNKTPIIPNGTSKRSGAKSRMSSDFQVTDEHRRYSTEHNFRSPDILFEAFKDHHAKNGNRFADWDAAFRTWIRNDTERFGGKQQIQGEFLG